MMNKQKESNIYNGMFLIDLDGTLLNKQKQIGKDDMQTLEMLGKHNFIRVFATGRTYYSSHQVINDDFPFDYLVFSSGAGIKNMKTGKIIYKVNLNKVQINYVINILKQMNVNFSIQHAIPDNHIYHYHKVKKTNTDFDWRNNMCKDFAYQLNSNFPYETATQFLVILDNEAEFKHIKNQIKNLKVIRATSPIDGKSIWLEIFPENVSKAAGGKHLCNLLNIPQEKTIGIGNDYNDLDLLNWTNKSFAVANSPDFIKNKFLLCADNENNPLSDVINKLDLPLTMQ